MGAILVTAAPMSSGRTVYVAILSLSKLGIGRKSSKNWRVRPAWRDSSVREWNCREKIEWVGVERGPRGI